jgi:hypothetical protein
MVAFSASRFVWCAIEVITLMTSPISMEDSPNFDTAVFAVSNAVPQIGKELCQAFPHLSDSIAALHLDFPGQVALARCRHHCQDAVYFLPKLLRRHPFAFNP